MISRLHGILMAKIPPTLLIDVNGVGYEVDVPMTTLYDLPELGERLTLHTHLAVREDAHQLFGFLIEEDRRLFRELIKVNGIGSRTALAILSSVSSLDFVECIVREDLTLLVKIPGIGKKTGERLIIEMRDRLKLWQTRGKGSDTPQPSKSGSPHQAKEEAISALIALGYRPADAEKVVEKCFNPNLSAEELIRQSLKNM